MERKPNKLRSKLSKGECVTGSVLYSWSPNMIDTAGYAGLDFMRVDNEHAWRQDGSVEHIMRAAALADVVILMRVDRDNPYLVRKALEIGAGGIIVPNIRNRKETEVVVRAAKFPPCGIRGYSGNCFSGGWGSRAGAEWIEWSDSEPMIGVMIENEEAVQNVDEIMTVKGIDFVLFGPADLSMSLGLRKPVKNDEKVQQSLRKTIKAAKENGKNVMINTGTNPSEIKKYVDMGVTMIEISTDIGVARAAWTQACKFVKEESK